MQHVIAKFCIVSVQAGCMLRLISDACFAYKQHCKSCCVGMYEIMLEVMCIVA